MRFTQVFQTVTICLHCLFTDMIHFTWAAEAHHKTKFIPETPKKGIVCYRGRP